MARIDTPDKLGEVLPDAVPIRTALPSYDSEAQTAPIRAASRDNARYADRAGDLRRAGDSVAGLGLAIAEKQEKDEEYEIQKKFIDFDLHHDLTLEDQKRAVDGNPTDFAGRFMAGYAESAKTFFKDVPDRLKPKVDEMLTQRAARYEKSAVDFENRKSDEYFETDLVKTLDEYRGVTQKNPGKYRENIARGLSLIETSRLSGDAKSKLKKRYAQETEETAIRARVEAGEDPVRILKDLDALPAALTQYSANGARTSEAQLQRTRDAEKFYPVAYKDGKRGYSVGFGTYGVKPGTRMTREEAEAAMLSEVRSVEADMTRKIEGKINQNQWDALVDLFYNIGTGKGRLDEVAEMINDGRANEVPNWIRKFDRADGVQLDGLVRRREQNAQLFAEPSDQMIDFGVKAEPLPPLEGVLTPPNVDLAAQPVLKNPDGSVSTVRTISFNRDGKEILIPTITPDGRDLKTPEAAIAEYDKTGKHLGIYSGVDAANEAAKRIHDSEERRVADSRAVYRHLDSQQRAQLKNIVEVAGRDAVLDDINSDIERIRIGGLGAAKTDDNGRFAIERAEGILTPNQISRAKRQLKEANLEHEAIKPLSNMSEDAALSHLEKFLPNAEADDESFASARRVEAKAERAWREIREAREKDPARAVNQAPEVRSIFDQIEESKDINGVPTIPGQKAQEMMIEARIEAQKRLGIRDPKPITRQEALRLMAMPDPSTMSDRDFRKKLEEARDRAFQIYGPKYARPAFEAAIGVITGNAREREIAAPVLRRMANGEAVQPTDVQKSQDLRSVSESDRLFTPPRPDEALRNGPVRPLSEAKDKKNWPKPNDKHIKALREGKGSAAQFDTKFGPGAASLLLGDKNAKAEKEKTGE